MPISLFRVPLGVLSCKLCAITHEDRVSDFDYVLKYILYVFDKCQILPLSAQEG